jgi:hypothetical protein
VVHAQVGDTLGRQALPLTVRSFDRAPAVSDLLVARPWGDTLVTRGAVVAALSRDLTFEVRTRMRAAVEVYGLPPGSDGRVHYTVASWLVATSQPTRQMPEDSLGRATVLSFDRQRPATWRSSGWTSARVGSTRGGTCSAWISPPRGAASAAPRRWSA